MLVVRYPLALLVVSLSSLGLSGCQERDYLKFAPIVETTLSQAGYGHIAQVSRQARTFYQQAKAFEKAVALVWGEKNVRQPTKDHFVRYTEGYRSRAEVDFRGGMMEVSTVDTKEHPQSREYAVISGYNGGAENVLKLFGKDRQYALNQINKLTPVQLYAKLNTQHPWAETRRYIKKVTRAKKNYMNL